MTIFQIIEYIEQKGSRKARIIEMLKQYSVETGSVVETTWVFPSIARVQREIQENRLRSTQPWVDSPRTVFVGDPDGEYRPVSHTESPRDILNVPNTQRIEIGEEIDYNEIDVF